ncbi:MAG: hypothetical protein GC184_10495 [Rhizobiales bacterium]|nr:hypothetical protein [Hyphomicrobiales bacterium]
MRPSLVWLHKQAGLFIGGALLLQAMAGVVIVFKHELEAPKTLPVSDHIISIDEAFASATAASDLPIIRIDFPASSKDVYRMRMMGTDQVPHLLEVSASDGHVVSQSLMLAHPLEFMLHFHQTWFADGLSTVLLTTIGLVGFFLSLSGLYLWWPRQHKILQALRIRGPVFTPPFWFSFHKSIGALACLIVAMLSITGALSALRGTVQPLIKQAPDIVAFDHAPEDQGSPISLDSMVKTATTAVHNMTATDMRLYKDVTLVVLRGDDSFITGRVWIDTYSGALIRAQDARNATWDVVLYDFILRLHDGDIAGLGGRIIVALGGLSLILLFLSGFSLYLGRRRAAVRRKPR